jgi:phytoene synthase
LTVAAATDPLDVVRRVARAGERDRYLSALLAPRAVRADLIALAAFAAEIARIPSLVEEPMMGEIRLQWWRDTVLPEGAGSSGHPVADAFLTTRRRHRLPALPVAQIIDAAGAGLRPEPHGDIADLHAHLLACEATQFELAARVLGIDVEAEAARRTIAAAGLATGLARTLVELPAVLAEGRMLLATREIAEAGASLDGLRSGTVPPSLAVVLERLVAEARLHVSHTRVALAEASPRLLAAVRPVALVEPYLRALERRGLTRLDEVVDLVPLARVSRLWLTRVRGTV